MRESDYRIKQKFYNMVETSSVEFSSLASYDNIFVAVRSCIDCRVAEVTNMKQQMSFGRKEINIYIPKIPLYEESEHAFEKHSSKLIVRFCVTGRKFSTH